MQAREAGDGSDLTPPMSKARSARSALRMPRRAGASLAQNFMPWNPLRAGGGGGGRVLSGALRWADECRGSARAVVCDGRQVGAAGRAFEESGCTSGAVTKPAVGEPAEKRSPVRVDSVAVEVSDRHADGVVQRRVVLEPGDEQSVAIENGPHEESLRSRAEGGRSTYPF